MKPIHNQHLKKQNQIPQTYSKNTNKTQMNPNKAIFDILDRTFSNIPSIVKRYANIHVVVPSATSASTSTSKSSIPTKEEKEIFIKLIQLCFAALSITFINPVWDGIGEEEDEEEDGLYFGGGGGLNHKDRKERGSGSSKQGFSEHTSTSSSMRISTDLVLWKEVGKRRSTRNTNPHGNAAENTVSDTVHETSDNPEIRPMLPCAVVYELWKAILQLQPPKTTTSSEEDTSVPSDVNIQDGIVLNAITTQLQLRYQAKKGISAKNEKEAPLKELPMDDELVCNLIRDLLVFLGVLDTISTPSKPASATASSETQPQSSIPTPTPIVSQLSPSPKTSEEGEEDTVESNDDSMNLTAWGNTSISASTTANINTSHLWNPHQTMASTCSISPSISTNHSLFSLHPNAVEQDVMYINHNINQQYGLHYYHTSIRNYQDKLPESSETKEELFSMWLHYLHNATADEKDTTSTDFGERGGSDTLMKKNPFDFFLEADLGDFLAKHISFIRWNQSLSHSLLSSYKLHQSQQQQQSPVHTTNEAVTNYNIQKLPFHLISSCYFSTLIKDCLTSPTFIKNRIDLLGIYYALVQHRLDSLLFSKQCYTICRWMFSSSATRMKEKEGGKGCSDFTTVIPNTNPPVEEDTTSTEKTPHTNDQINYEESEEELTTDTQEEDLYITNIRKQKMKQQQQMKLAINTQTKKITIDAYRCYNTIVCQYISDLQEEYQVLLRMEGEKDDRGEEEDSSISSKEDMNEPLPSIKQKQTIQQKKTTPKLQNKETNNSIQSKVQILTTTIHYLGMSFGELELVEDEIQLYHKALKLQKEYSLPKNKTLHCIGASYQHQGNYYKAMSCYMEAIDTWKEENKEEEEEHCKDYKTTDQKEEDVLCLADTYHNMGVILCELADHNQAKSMIEESLRIRRNALGDAHPDIADSLQWIGKIYREMGNTEEALRHFKAAHYGKERYLGKDHLEVAECLHNLGIVYGDIEDFGTSTECFKEALRIRYLKVNCSGSQGKDEIIESLLCIANSYLAISDGREDENALYYLKEAIISCEVRFHSSIQRISFKDTNLHDNDNSISKGDTNVNDDSINEQYQNILQCYDRVISLTIQKSNRDDQHLDIGILYFQYGKIHEAFHAEELALQCYEMSLGILRQHMDQYFLGIVLNTLGVYHAKRKHTLQAYTYFEEALLVRKLKLGTQHLDYISTLHNIGNIYVKMKRYDKALTCYNDVLYVRKLKLSSDHISVARTLHNMGHVFEILQENDGSNANSEDALKSFQEALRIRQLKLGSNHMDVAYTLHALGMTYFKNQDVSSAQTYFMDSLRIRKLNLGEFYNQHPLVAESLYWVGMVHQEKTEYDIAEVYFMESLGIYEFCSSRQGNNGNIANVLIHLAFIYDCNEKNQGLSSSSSISYQHKVIECLDKALSIQKEISTAEKHNDQDLSIAETEQKLGAAYFKMKDHYKALECFKNVLHVFQKKFGKNNSRSAKVMHDIGIIYRDNYGGGEFELGKRCLLDALNIRKFVFLVNDTDGDHEDIADTLNELGVLYDLENDNNSASVLDSSTNDTSLESSSKKKKKKKKNSKIEALDYLQSSLDMYERLFGLESLQVAKVLHNKGNFHRRNKDLKEAKICYDTALHNTSKKVGVNGMTSATILKDMGELHYELKDYNKAHECFEEVLRVTKVFHNNDGDHISIADALFNCGLAHHKLDDVDSAMLCFNDVLRIQKLHYGEEEGDDSCSIAPALVEIGNILSSKEQYHKALKCYEQVLCIRKKLDRKQKSNNNNTSSSGSGTTTQGNRQHSTFLSSDVVANMHYSISICHQNLKKFDESLRSAQISLDIQKEALGPSHMDLCKIVEVMGQTYQLKGMYREALKYFKEILRLQKINLSDNDDIQFALTLDQISALYQVQREREKALKHMKESLRIRSTKLGNDHPEVGTTLFGMGIIFCDMGKHNDAVKCYETALTIRKRKLGCNSIQVAQILHNLGSVHAMRKEYERALYRWRGALSIYRGLGFSDDDNMVKCTLGNIHMAEDLSKQQAVSKPNPII